MTSRLSFVIPLATACLLNSVGFAADSDFSSLEERMTGQEFRETGLHKLSDEELAALNRWIHRHSLAEHEWAEQQARSGDGNTASGPEDRRGLFSRDRGDTPIHARIVGTFNGWTGKTVFELDNGMVWQQTDGTTFFVSGMDNPEVIIRPALFGTWRLQVPGYDSQARVQRIR